MNAKHRPEPGDRRGAWGLAGFALAVTVASLWMPRALWGLAAPADLPAWLSVLGALLVMTACLPGVGRQVEKTLATMGRGSFAVGVVALLLMLFNWMSRIRLHWLGDQAIWLRSFKSDDTFHALEPASFALVRASANAWPGRDPGEGALILSVGMGGVFVLLAWLLSGELERGSPARRVWLWGMLICVPQLLFYRGYVESYPYLLVCLVALAWILLRTRRGESLRWAWPVALASTAAHVMGVGTAPAVVYAGWRRGPNRWVAVIGVMLGVLLVALWLLAQRSRVPALGSLPMTFAVFDLRSQGWDGFLSPGHLLGIANILLVVGGPLVWVAFALPWRTWARTEASVLLLFLVAPGLLGLFVVRLLLGPVRDWDLFSSYLYFLTPVLATGWLARVPGPRLPRYSIGLLGLAFVHTMFWGSVDVDPEHGFRRAARLYGEASTFAPEARGRAAEDLGAEARELGDNQGRKRWYELAVQAMPKHWRYQSNLGSAALSLGDVEEAKTAFTRAVALSPKVRSPYASLGSIHLREGRVSEAMEIYDQGLRHAGPDFGLYYGKGVCLAMLSQFPLAASALDSALVLSPGNASALLYRGLVALRMGEPKQSISFLRRSLRIDPGQEGWQYLVEAAVATGDSALARAARARSPNALSP